MSEPNQSINRLVYGAVCAPRFRSNPHAHTHAHAHAKETRSIRPTETDDCWLTDACNIAFRFLTIITHIHRPQGPTAMASQGVPAGFRQSKEASTGASILTCSAHDREVCGPCHLDFAQANASRRHLAATGGNRPNEFDPNQPIVGGGTVRTSFGSKTVAVLHVGTQLSMSNLSGDGRPGLVGVIREYAYRDPDRCGGQKLPSYQIRFDDGDTEYVAIEDVGDARGQWRVLSRERGGGVVDRGERGGGTAWLPLVIDY
jgi:hypothetical protein